MLRTTDLNSLVPSPTPPNRPALAPLSKCVATRLKRSQQTRSDGEHASATSVELTSRTSCQRLPASSLAPIQATTGAAVLFFAIRVAGFCSRQTCGASASNARAQNAAPRTSHPSQKPKPWKAKGDVCRWLRGNHRRDTKPPFSRKCRPLCDLPRAHGDVAATVFRSSHLRFLGMRRASPRSPPDPSLPICCRRKRSAHHAVVLGLPAPAAPALPRLSVSSLKVRKPELVLAARFPSAWRAATDSSTQRRSRLWTALNVLSPAR